MRTLSRLLDSPFAFGITVFLIILISGTQAGFIGGLIIASQGCEPIGPGDPCDGPSMAAAASWYVSLVGSAILGIIVGTFCTLVLRQEATKPISISWDE